MEGCAPFSSPPSLSLFLSLSFHSLLLAFYDLIPDHLAKLATLGPPIAMFEG